jgi:hypothetical protein
LMLGITNKCSFLIIVILGSEKHACWFGASLLF